MMRAAAPALRGPRARAALGRRNASGQPTVAMVGATGAVGQEVLSILEGRNFPVGDLRLFAAPHEAGTQCQFRGKGYTVQALGDGSFKGVDFAFFSAGEGASEEWAPKAAAGGTVCIDNSSAFRMDPGTPLVVPEVNPAAARAHKGIIANPNCSTIIMHMAVFPIYKAVGVSRVVCSTYQAASGAGMAAMDELEQQGKDWAAGRPLTQDIFKRQYIWNLFSHNSGIDLETGYNGEELKMIHETRKIFGDQDIMVTATCIRIPVLRAHCESINMTLKKPMTAAEAREVLSKAPGVRIADDRVANKHPEPLDVAGKDDCAIGRIRQDLSQKGNLGLEVFIAGDQIRKGAALNAIQIAELLLKA